MFGIHRYVKAADGQFDGWVFPVRPGFESKAIELFRTVVDRCAEKVGRSEERPEMLGIFVAGDTVQNVIPDGTHELFLAEVMLELARHNQETHRSEGPDHTESGASAAEVLAAVIRQRSKKRKGKQQDETEV